MLNTSFGAQGNNDIQVNGYSDIITFDGPVAYYRFEETTGATTKNFGTSGTNNTGLWMVGNGPDDSSPGTASVEAGPRPPDFKGFASTNNAGKFPGPDATIWVDTQGQLLDSLPAFSLEYWVKPFNRVSDPTAFGTRIGIVGQNDAVEYGFIDQNTIQIWTPGGGQLNTTYSFPDNTWHHVATIATGADIRNYFDGVLVGTGGSSAGGNYGSSTFKVHIGGGGVYDGTGNFFTGDIDEVAIFDKSIDASRIAQHYKAGKEGAFTVPFINKPTGGIDSFSIQVKDFAPVIADTNTIVLSLNGNSVKPTSVTKTNGVTTVTYAPPTAFPSQSVQNTTMSINDTQGLTYTDSGTFTVPYYATIAASFAVTGVDTSKAGFKVKPYQVTQANPNTIGWTEEMFAGLHGTNIADLSQVGADGYLTYTGVINWDRDIATAVHGNFTANNGYTDTPQPGFPSASGTYDNSGEEILTFVQFPAAGFYTMGVNSDDGFRLSTGTNLKDAFKSVTLGVFNGGRGASDSLFKFNVEKAGIYPMRLLYENGTGDANLEWFTVQPDGTKILLNDPASTNTSGIKAFSSGPIPTTPAYIASFAPTLVGGKFVLVDGTTQVTAGSSKVSVNGAAATTTDSKAGAGTTVAYSLASPVSSGATVNVTLLYKDNTSATVTNTTTYLAGTYSGTTKDSVKGYVGFIRGTGSGGFTADKGGHSGKAGDYAMDSGPTGGTWIDVADASFLNDAAKNDILSVTLWVKKYDIAAGSAFWFISPSSNNSQRGYQAHIPWSDDNIYFDTSGCCDANLQRINAKIDTFADYPGDDSYWTNWHHFVFTKKADQKNIYIDGKLFLNGSNTSPLPTDFNEIYLFVTGDLASFMHGIIDDFAIFSTEVSAADAVKLAAGTSPKDLTGETLIAYWDFNDANQGTGGSSFTQITVSADRKSFTATYTGTLQSADAVTGAWADVPGAASPATIPIGAGNKFYRVH
jgi:hypothetical protein